ncbi:hypothetical protein HD554DRAFT_2170772 [Boletus coccyginus]|nr:hypothetical protein HD554DRAFT_2170772 [Boletus coccyginus]
MLWKRFIVTSRTAVESYPHQLTSCPSILIAPPLPSPNAFGVIVSATIERIVPITPARIATSQPLAILSPLAFVRNATFAIIGDMHADFALNDTTNYLYPLHTQPQVLVTHNFYLLPMDPKLLSDQQQELLNQFSCFTWGHPEHCLKEDEFSESGFIQFIDVAFEFLFAGILRSGKILVRDEYHTALVALQGDEYNCGVIIIGQPGIGKTLFLIYLLVWALGQKQAVALELPAALGYYALFTEKGVHVHSVMNSRPLLSHLPPVWALCDFNHGTKTPSSIFTGTLGHTRVVQTTAPTYSSWKGWRKQIGAEPYIMDIWSNEEVKKLAVLQQLDVKHLTSLAEKWGGVPQRLLYCLSKSTDVVEREYCISKMSPQL